VIYFLLREKSSLEPKSCIVPMPTFGLRFTYLQLILFCNRWCCTSLYKKASTAGPHAYLLRSSKSRKNYRYLRETLLLLLSTNRTPPMNLRIHARVNLCSCSTLPSWLFICEKWSASQLNLTTLPWSSPSCGMTPNNSPHNSAQSRLVWPINGVPSTRKLNNTETSWRVIIHYPHFMWNVCVSGLHLSIKAVINDEFIFR